MGRKENSFRRDNRGLTLIELLCSIAIFAFITAAIGSVLVVTAKTYQGGTTEATLQQEAQLAANIIEGLIVDAKKSINLCYYDGGGEHTVLDASSIPAGCDRKLKIADDGSNRTDIIYEASTKRLLYQKTVAGTEGDKYVLAENVEEFGADLKGFDESHNVVLNIELKKDSRAFDAEYTVTTRNANVTTAPYVPDRWATISCDAEITLEPNQEYVLPVTVDANVSDKSYTATLENVSQPTQTSRSYDTNGIRIKIGNDETGSASNNMLLWIKTNAKQSDGSTPLAEKFVNIKIRRVDDIDVEFTPDGGSFTAGTVYTVNSTLTATPYLYQEVNEVGGAYVNPCDVDWSYQFSGGGVTAQSGSISGTTTTSYFKFTETQGEYGTPAKVTVELLSDMPSGSSLTVTGTAAHPSGVNKKSPLVYKTGVVDSDTITNAATPPPLGSNFKRGTEYMFQGTEYLSVTCDTSCVPNGVQTMKRYFWRYREINEDGSKGAWSRYRRTIENSDVTHKINQVETLLLRPDKAYELEFIVALLGQSNNTLYYPFNDNLLAPGVGFESFTKGWSGVTQTPESEYSSRYTIGATKLKFEEVQNSNVYAYGIGTQAAPIHMISGQTYQYDIDADYMHYGNTQAQYKLVVEEYNGTNWVASSKTYTDFNIQIDSQFIKFTNIPTSITGMYRFCYRADGYVMKELTNTDVLNPTYGNVAAQNFNLYNVTSDPTDVEAGVIYVTFN